MDKTKFMLIGLAVVILLALILSIGQLSGRIEELEEENDRLYTEVMAERLKCLTTEECCEINFIKSDDIDQYIYEAMGYFDVRFPDLVYAQSILETGYYSSDMCLQKNNLFGLYDSTNHTYRTYKYWWESVREYKRLVQDKFKGETLEEYLIFLDTLPYATDTAYITKLKDVYYELIPE